MPAVKLKMAKRKPIEKKILNMVDLPFPVYGLDTDGTSQSLFGMWLKCPRSFLLRISGVSGPDRGNYAHGSMMHDWLDKLYSSSRDGTTKTESEREALTLSFFETYEIKGKSDTEAERMKTIGQAVAIGYLKHYAADFDEMRFQEVEGLFDFDAPGKGVSGKLKRVLMRGKKDGKFADKNGGIWLMEHKNYARIEEGTLMSTLSYDLQNLFYFSTEAEWDDVGPVKTDLKGVLYNILRKPDVKKAMGNAELYKYVSDNIAADPDHYFKRYEIPLTITDLKIWWSETVQQLFQLQNALSCAEFSETVGTKSQDGSPLSPRWTKFYKNPTACAGKYACEYIELCSSGGNLAGYETGKKLFTELDGE